MKKLLIFCAMILVLNIVNITNAFGWTEDDIIGYWQDDKGYMVSKIVKSTDSNKFDIYNQKDNEYSKPGDFSAEISFKGMYETWNYVGRHVWGNTRDMKTYSWGKEGGIVITVIDYNTIRVVYLDSKYTGGWILRRQ